MKGSRGHWLIPALLAGFVVMQPMVTTVAAADENRQKGWFFEAGIGSTRDQNELASGVDTGGSPYMKRAYLSYAFTRFFGVQGGYVDVDTIKYDRTPGTEGNVDQYDLSGPHVKVFGTIPFHREVDRFYGVTLSGGGWRWNTKARTNAEDRHSHGFGPTAGVGLVFAGRTSAIKLEYERFWLKPNVPAGAFTKSGEVNLQYDVVSVNFQFFI
jgi:hypothetical protein